MLPARLVARKELRERDDVVGTKGTKGTVGTRAVKSANAANAANAKKVPRAKRAQSADAVLGTGTGTGTASSPSLSLRSSDVYTKCNNSILTQDGSSNFIFFGCWNNINCKKEYIYRDIVLDCIDKVEKETRQLYIAGDNWYTNIKKIGEKDYKVYLTDILRTGYSKLYSMDKDVYIAVGNHDQDSNVLGTAGDLRKNCNINTQKYYLEQIKAITATQAMTATQAVPVITEPTLQFLQSLANEGKLEDSVLCEKGVYIYVDNIGVRYNKNNIVIIINTNKFDDFATARRYLQELKGVIKKVATVATAVTAATASATTVPCQIFVMGHIPLFSFKNNTIAIQEINKEKLYYRAIILQLYDILAKHNIIYICADTHHFSIMEIKCGTKVVIQITAGTGGADPDIITENYVTTPINRQLAFTLKPHITPYHIKAFALNPYGYVNITISPEKVDVCYKQVNIATVSPVALKSPVAPKSPVALKQQRSRSSSSSNDSVTNVTNVTNVTKVVMDEITYKINRNTRKPAKPGNAVYSIEYVNTTKGAQTAFFSNYKSKRICKAISKEEKGYITDDAGSLLCFRKEVKDKKGDKSESKESKEPKEAKELKR